MEIGQWIRRVMRGKRTKWHLIESIIADAAITNCGRRLEPQIKVMSGFEFSDVEPLTRMIGQPQNCKQCS